MVTHQTGLCERKWVNIQSKDTRKEKENEVGVLANIAFAVYTRRVG